MRNVMCKGFWTNMKNLINFIVLFIVLLSTSCANANVSRNREAYILSQPHGWVEIEFFDAEVPPDPPSKDVTKEELESWQPRPPSCYLKIKLNNEKFLYESIYPYGEAPRYIVDTGFRFPAPVGSFFLEIVYEGCDVDQEGTTASQSATMDILIEENMVTPIKYNGRDFNLETIKENTVITLDDIYTAIQQTE